jgi:hypothetical protein
MHRGARIWLESVGPEARAEWLRLAAYLSGSDEGVFLYG